MIIKALGMLFFIATLFSHSVCAKPKRTTLINTLVMAQIAIEQYSEANNGMLPKKWSDLDPYWEKEMIEAGLGGSLNEFLLLIASPEKQFFVDGKVILALSKKISPDGNWYGTGNNPDFGFSRISPEQFRSSGLERFLAQQANENKSSTSSKWLYIVEGIALLIVIVILLRTAKRKEASG